MAKEEALARKKKVRAAHRAWASRLMSQAESVLEDSKIDVDTLALLQTNLSAKLATLEALDKELVELIPEEELEDEIGRADEYAEKIHKTLGQIRKTKTSNLSVATPSGALLLHTQSNDHTPSAHSAVGETVSSSSKVKLPKISLPHFKGNPIYWTAFWDSYESAVHLNDSLSDIDKFNYLRSLLEKTAYEVIAGLTLSSANYREAIDILKKRFGNRQMIISRHMETLLNLNAVTGEHDVKGLRRLFDEVETSVRSLKALGVEQESYGTMLTSVLLTKLPSEIRLIMTRKSPSEDIDLETLLKVWEEELIARERSRDPDRNNRHPQDRQDKPRSSPTATTLLSGTTESTKALNGCCYCQQQHSSVDCHTVTSLDDRRQILKTSGRCFNCLIKGHIGRKCHSSPQCQTCNRKHHPSICDQSAAVYQNSPSSSTNTVVSTINPDASPLLSPTMNVLSPTGRKCVLLQTARALICNPKTPDSPVELRILLDGGSQQSYMTERARRALKVDSERARRALKVDSKGEQQLSIAAFGCSRGDSKVCPIVNVKILLKGCPSIDVTLFVVPIICEHGPSSRELGKILMWIQLN